MVRCLATAIQTGPSGAGADLGGLGGDVGMQEEPATVRTLLFSHDKLYAADGKNYITLIP